MRWLVLSADVLALAPLFRFYWNTRTGNYKGGQR